MLTVYSKQVCPYCVNAKRFLQEHGFAFREVDVEQDTEALDFIRSEGHRTVPQIYFQGKLFVSGGWEGLSKFTAQQLREEIELRESLASGTL